LTFSWKAAGTKQANLESAVVEYTANSRGFYQKITIQNQMVLISKDRSGNEGRGYKDSCG
jgi:hypothetical protein